MDQQNATGLDDHHQQNATGHKSASTLRRSLPDDHEVETNCDIVPYVDAKRPKWTEMASDDDSMAICASVHVTSHDHVTCSHAEDSVQAELPCMHPFGFLMVHTSIKYIAKHGRLESGYSWVSVLPILIKTLRFIVEILKIRSKELIPDNPITPSDSPRKLSTTDTPLLLKTQDLLCNSIEDIIESDDDAPVSVVTFPRPKRIAEKPIVPEHILDARRKRDLDDIIERLMTFETGPPFTIQRVCELLSTPFEWHNKPETYLRAMGSCVYVASECCELDYFASMLTTVFNDQVIHVSSVGKAETVEI